LYVCILYLYQSGQTQISDNELKATEPAHENYPKP